MSINKNTTEWDIIVKPKTALFKLNFSEIWAYKDLILLFVKRDITSLYKQTILGPLWMVIQPIFTSLIYTFTFSKTAGLSTDGIPDILFYLMGQTFWIYFADSLNKTSSTFVSNAAVFGKVYFPRLVVPISIVISNLVKLGIQIAFLTVFYLYFYFATSQLNIQLQHLALIPLLIVFLGLFGLSLGILFSSFTTKYRDFTFLLGFTVQLLMFASCVVFPVSMYSPKLQNYFLYNPVVAYLEAIKYTLTGHGILSFYHLIIDSVGVLFTLLVAILIFNKTEKSFMDTV